MARPAGADEIVALHREARHEEALAAIMEPLTRKDSRAADQTDQTAAAVRLNSGRQWPKRTSWNATYQSALVHIHAA